MFSCWHRTTIEMIDGEGLSAHGGEAARRFREAIVGTDIWRMDGLRQQVPQRDRLRRFQEI
jgi:hypothetical protein